MSLKIKGDAAKKLESISRRRIRVYGQARIGAKAASEPIHNAAMDTWNIFEISFHDFTRLERSIIPAHGY